MSTPDISSFDFEDDDSDFEKLNQILTKENELRKNSLANEIKNSGEQLLKEIEIKNEEKEKEKKSKIDYILSHSEIREYLVYDMTDLELNETYEKFKYDNLPFFKKLIIYLFG